MKHVFYYRVTDPDILRAFRADKLDIGRIEGVGVQFANLFGAVPLFTAGYGSHFAGITFLKGTLPMQPQLWTKLEEGTPTVPRSPERAGSKDRAAAEALYKRFHDNWPKEIEAERVSKLYTALGVSFEQLKDELFVFDEFKGDGYLMSTLRFNYDEITTSVYLDAINEKRKANG